MTPFIRTFVYSIATILITPHGAFAKDIRSTTTSAAIRVEPVVNGEVTGANVELCNFSHTTKTYSQCQPISKYRTFYTTREIEGLADKLYVGFRSNRTDNAIFGLLTGSLVGILGTFLAVGTATVVTGGTILIPVAIGAVAGTGIGVLATPAVEEQAYSIREGVSKDRDLYVERIEFQEIYKVLQDELNAMK